MEFLVTKTKGFAVSYLTREPDEPDVLENEIDETPGTGRAGEGPDGGAEVLDLIC